MALEKDFRSPHSPSPIYGLRPGFNVGDLDRPYGQAPIAGIASTSSSVAAPSAISPQARVVKVTVYVTSGTGSVDVTLKSATDTYTAALLDTGALTLGTYEFYVGGWANPTSNSDATFKATQYGPVVAGVTPDKGNTTGDEEPVSTGNADPASSSNYVGGTYNPVDFISLAGADVKVYSVVVGTVTYRVDVVPVS